MLKRKLTCFIGSSGCHTGRQRYLVEGRNNKDYNNDDDNGDEDEDDDVKDKSDETTIATT